MKEVAVEGTFIAEKGGSMILRIHLESRDMTLISKGPREGLVTIRFSAAELKELRDFLDKVGPVLDSGEMASLL